MQAFDDVLHQLRRHQALSNVSLTRQDGRALVTADVAVELPSRAAAAGISATGVRAVEPCTLAFSEGWPVVAPRVFLRSDFPRDLPHINPGRPGRGVSPCLFEGSLDEILSRFGLDAIVDQLVAWLNKAAANQLIDLTQGWEPTRRDSAPSVVVFEADMVKNQIPVDGSLLTVPATYFATDEGICGYLRSPIKHSSNTRFTQEAVRGLSQKWHQGETVAIIAQAQHVDGKAPVFDRYTPETVHDLDSLLERACELGIDNVDVGKEFTRLLSQRGYHQRDPLKDGSSAFSPSLFLPFNVRPTWSGHQDGVSNS